jgi:hypothetical protein
MRFYVFVMLFGISINVCATNMNDNQIRKIIIKRSIDNYIGNCPCPYNVTRNGRICGRRSAYSKIGGYSPICYPNDVTIKMIKQFRQSK